MSSIDNLLNGPSRSNRFKSHVNNKPYNKPYSKRSSSKDEGDWKHDRFIQSIGGELGTRLESKSLLEKSTSSIPVDNNNHNNDKVKSLQSRISGLARRSKKPINKNNNKNRKSVNIKGSSFKPVTISMENLAIGTSAEDVKVALSSFGNILDCNLNSLKSNDESVTVDVKFEKLEMAQKAIEEFNGLLADGRLLKVRIIENIDINDIKAIFNSSNKMYADTIPNNNNNSNEIKRDNTSNEIMEIDKPNSITTSTTKTTATSNSLFDRFNNPSSINNIQNINKIINKNNDKSNNNKSDSLAHRLGL